MSETSETIGGTGHMIIGPRRAGLGLTTGDAGLRDLRPLLASKATEERVWTIPQYAISWHEELGWDMDLRTRKCHNSCVIVTD